MAGRNNHRGANKCTLTCFGRSIPGPLYLLGNDENALTFALGYVLSEFPRFRSALLKRLGFPARSTSGRCDIRLQDLSAEGITDIEIEGRHWQVCIEAKKAGWPGKPQIQRYATKLSRFSGQKIMCALGAPPLGSSPIRSWQPAGVRLVHLRWGDILELINAVYPQGHTQLNEYSQMIREVLHMQSYDREVLIRDLIWEESRLKRFFQHHFYRCQIAEKAEPLFFAPCFCRAPAPMQNGVHYFSRVYHKAFLSFKDRKQTEAALAEAHGAIDVRIEALRGRKTADRERAYLRELKKRWTKGIRADQRAQRLREENAVFFLGEPIPLPRPLHKTGKMIPVGFSMPLEHLMKADELRC